MDSEAAAASAIQELNGHELQGRKMKVELSESKGGKQKNTQKLFVGNVADGTTSQVGKYEELFLLLKICFRS